jgi:vacuolar-type H+-ATPase subunit E/Vma4
VVLTPEGEAIEESVDQAIFNANEKVVGILKPRESEDLRLLLDKIAPRE